MLLAIDDGANGRFAARAAGLLAGMRNMPVTILDVRAVKTTNGNGDETRQNESGAREIVVAAAKQAGAKRDEPPTIDVIVRKHDVAPDEAIATEARRGYDLLVVGIDDAVAKCRMGVTSAAEVLRVTTVGV